MQKRFLIAVLLEVIMLEGDVFVPIFGQGQIDGLKFVIVSGLCCLVKRRLEMAGEDIYNGWKDEKEVMK